MFEPTPRRNKALPTDIEELARYYGAVAFSQFMIQRITWGDLFEGDGSTVCLN